MNFSSSSSSSLPKTIKIKYGTYQGAEISIPNFFYKIADEEDRDNAAVVFMAMLDINQEARQTSRFGEYIRMLEVDDYCDGGKGIHLAGYGMNRELTLVELDHFKKLCNNHVLLSVQWIPDKRSRSILDGRYMTGALVALIQTRAYLNGEIQTSSISLPPLPPPRIFTHSSSSSSSSTTLPPISSIHQMDSLNRRINHLLKPDTFDSLPSLSRRITNQSSSDNDLSKKKYDSLSNRGGITKQSSSSSNKDFSISSFSKRIESSSSSSPSLPKKVEKKVFNEIKKDFLKKRGLFTRIMDYCTGFSDELIEEFEQSTEEKDE